MEIHTGHIPISTVCITLLLSICYKVAFLSEDNRCEWYFNNNFANGDTSITQQYSADLSVYNIVEPCHKSNWYNREVPAVICHGLLMLYH